MSHSDFAAGVLQACRDAGMSALATGVHLQLCRVKVAGGFGSAGSQPTVVSPAVKTPVVAAAVRTPRPSEHHAVTLGSPATVATRPPSAPPINRTSPRVSASAAAIDADAASQAAESAAAYSRQQLLLSAARRPSRHSDGTTQQEQLQRVVMRKEDRASQLPQAAQLKHQQAQETAITQLGASPRYPAGLTREQKEIFDAHVVRRQEVVAERPSVAGENAGVLTNAVDMAPDVSRRLGQAVWGKFNHGGGLLGEATGRLTFEGIQKLKAYRIPVPDSVTDAVAAFTQSAIEHGQAGADTTLQAGRYRPTGIGLAEGDSALTELRDRQTSRILDSNQSLMGYSPESQAGALRSAHAYGENNTRAALELMTLQGVTGGLGATAGAFGRVAKGSSPWLSGLARVGQGSAHVANFVPKLKNFVARLDATKDLVSPVASSVSGVAGAWEGAADHVNSVLQPVGEFAGQAVPPTIAGYDTKDLRTLVEYAPLMALQSLAGRYMPKVSIPAIPGVAKAISAAPSLADEFLAGAKPTSTAITPTGPTLIPENVDWNNLSPIMTSVLQPPPRDQLARPEIWDSYKGQLDAIDANITKNFDALSPDGLAKLSPQIVDGRKALYDAAGGDAAATQDRLTAGGVTDADAAAAAKKLNIPVINTQENAGGGQEQQREETGDTSVLDGIGDLFPEFSQHFQSLDPQSQMLMILGVPLAMIGVLGGGAPLAAIGGLLGFAGWHGGKVPWVTPGAKGADGTTSTAAGDAATTAADGTPQTATPLDDAGFSQALSTLTPGDKKTAGVLWSNNYSEPDRRTAMWQAAKTADLVALQAEQAQYDARPPLWGSRPTQSQLTKLREGLQGRSTQFGSGLLQPDGIKTQARNTAAAETGLTGPALEAFLQAALSR